MVDTQTVLNELNLDDTPENETLMTNLLSQSSAVIMGALPTMLTKQRYTVTLYMSGQLSH